MGGSGRARTVSAMERDQLDPTVFGPPPDLSRPRRPHTPSPHLGASAPKNLKVAKTPRFARQRKTSGTTSQWGPVGGMPLPEPARKSLRATLAGVSWMTRLSIALFLGAGIALVLRMTILEGYQVPSGSMDSTLAPDDRILVEKLSYILGTPKRGDVIVFNAPAGWDDDPAKTVFLKRVVATEGDTVRCCDAKGRLMVNTIPVDETYTSTKTERFKRVKVPAGHLFLMGDNRADSDDSRFRGTVPVTAVIGKVVARTWPLNHVGGIAGP